MARFTQIIGLNRWSTQLVSATEKATEIGRRFFEDGRVEEFEREVQISTATKREIGSFGGMFDETYPLFEYTLKDGRVFQEYVQAEPWSSGPCIFLALKQWARMDEGLIPVSESLWTYEEIQAA